MTTSTKDDILSMETLKAMQQYTFEAFCKIYFECIGYKTAATDASLAEGINILLYKDNESAPMAAVQCKTRTNGQVGPKNIKELLDLVTTKNIKNGILMTNTQFTEAASREFNKTNQLSLFTQHDIYMIDAEKLLKKINGLGADKKQKLTMFLQAVDNLTPTCPNCGIKMVQRVAKKGDRKGGVFWGCPNYSKGCTHIQQRQPAEEHFFTSLAINTGHNDAKKANSGQPET